MPELKNDLFPYFCANSFIALRKKDGIRPFFRQPPCLHNHTGLFFLTFLNGMKTACK
jgi:hypothetical protein